MVEIGDRVLVMPSWYGNHIVELYTPDVGDKVILYPLKDLSRIAVPALNLVELEEVYFVSPEFQFAGFDWKLDFNFNLIPLIMIIPFGAIPLKLWQGGSTYDLPLLITDYPKPGDFYYPVGGSTVADVFVRPTDESVGDIYINYTNSTIGEKHSKVIYKNTCLSWNQPGYYPPTNEGKLVATVNFKTNKILYRYDPCT